ncbi:MAG: hypothetical protein IPG50_07400 [Myxococcales bacterium]|nr:hypothetical protein [Myxococcales bacterium]
MSRAVEWTSPAARDLAALPDWRLAALVDAAVDRHATEGIGFVLHVRVEDGPDEFRLLIPQVRTYVLIRRTPTTLTVERVIYRP